MGVNGLWTVVQPCARPTNLATLNRKRLAVDASIWIYQFLKAVRDKEGNALRNSHVVGFFRRICKLLWFGIQPVFVFDGGAPALKRATIQARTRRREGRRDDAVRTAGKLLAKQMQRLAEEDEDKRRRQRESGARPDEQEEELPDMSTVTYEEEFHMTQKERQTSRNFRKQDAYHLPEIDGSIAAMRNSDDPRIMSVQELEEYARQFNSGEDINLYDFSKIDFDGDFFKSLPAADRYNILNAARLRSRLRLGYSKEQLDDMFPDRMAFSKFQIERVQERNHLTQRLMYEVGMTGTDLTLGVNARVAGEKDREYILVKNEGAEGGWALGVVSKEKDKGEAHKPIDVDALAIQYQSKDGAQDDEDEDEDDFEDVPIEGVNRLPKAKHDPNLQDLAIRRQQFYDSQTSNHIDENGDDSLFVGGNNAEADRIHEIQPQDEARQDEEDDINRAIALSLQNQYPPVQNPGAGQKPETEEQKAPEWKQRATDEARPIIGKGGSMIAHIVNNRANASMASQQERPAPAVASDSDSEDDMQAVLAKARRKKQETFKPTVENKKNPFDGPLPFPKLDLGSSLFGKKTQKEPSPLVPEQQLPSRNDNPDPVEDDDDQAGGFEVPSEDAPKPLPPWMQNDETDIREAWKQRQNIAREMNADDKAEAEEEERLQRRAMRDAIIEIDSSGDEGDIEIIDKPDSPKKQDTSHPSSPPAPPAGDSTHDMDSSLAQDKGVSATAADMTRPTQEESSPEPEFEEVVLQKATSADQVLPAFKQSSTSPEPDFEDIPALIPAMEIDPADKRTSAPVELPENDIAEAQAAGGDDDFFSDREYDEFSDPEDEELMAQMAKEAEEHARFASELNSKSAQQNKEEYEMELRQLRNQQKKDRRDADEVTQVMVTECQALLRLFGIPFITAPMEAEAQCAELVSLGLVDGIVTDDSDTFLFGGTRVYKNMFNSNKFVECYLGSDLDKDLSLSREQLISLAQLLGSDYTEGLHGIGPVTAVEILSEFPGKTGLEDFREWWLSVQSQQRPKAEDAHSSFRKKFRKAQGTKLFLPAGFPSSAVFDAYLHPEVDNDAEPFQWGVPDVEGLRQFLMATIGWSKERTDEVLVPVVRDMNKRDAEGTQANITRFFGGSVGAGARETFAPRQKLQGSSKRMAAAVDKLRTKVAGEGHGEGASSSANTRKRPAGEGATENEDEYAEGDDGKEVATKKPRGKGKKAKVS